MKRLIEASAILLALMVSTNVSATMIYDLSFTGDLTGSGVFIYDDTSGAERVEELSWDFGGGMSGNVSASFLSGLSPLSATNTFKTITGVPPLGIAFTPPAISGFPDEQIEFSYTSRDPLNPQEWLVIDARGFFEGKYSSTMRGVPEPTTLFMLGTGLVGLVGCARRRGR